MFSCLGHKSFTSETARVRKFRAEDDSALYDTPGSYDTSGLSQRLVNAVAISRALASMRSAKFVCFINYNSLSKAGDRGRLFHETLHTLRMFAHGKLADKTLANGSHEAQTAASQFLSHFLFVFTMVPESVTSDTVSGLLEDFIRESRGNRTLTLSSDILVRHICEQLLEYKSALLLNPVLQKPAALLDVLRNIKPMESPGGQTGCLIDAPTMDRLRAEARSTLSRVETFVGYEPGPAAAATAGAYRADDGNAFFANGHPRGVPRDDLRLGGIFFSPVFCSCAR